MKAPKQFPVFAHNMMGNDERLFIRDIGKTGDKVQCIARDTENFTSFTKTIKVDKCMDEGENIKPVETKIHFKDQECFKWPVTRSVHPRKNNGVRVDAKRG